MIEDVIAKQLAAAIDAYNDGGIDALEPYLAEDIVWHVGGRHPLSGIYRGRDAVTDYHRRAAALCDEPLRVEVSEIIAGRTHVAAFVRARGARNGAVLDAGLAEAIALDEDGHWTEYRALSDEQDQIDAFWSATTLDLRENEPSKTTTA